MQYHYQFAEISINSIDVIDVYHLGWGYLPDKESVNKRHRKGIYDRMEYPPSNGNAPDNTSKALKLVLISLNNNVRSIASSNNNN